MPVLTLDQIESLCVDALKLAGASDDQAAIFAEEIMDAEAEGIFGDFLRKTIEVVIF